MDEYEIIIPETFWLLNRKWEVVWDEHLSRKTVGECRNEKGQIALRPGLSRPVLEHTFLHELAHAFCFTLGWEKLNADEGKIDAISGVLHQYLLSFDGELSSPSEEA